MIAAIKVGGSCSLFKQSMHLLFHGVPDGVDLRQVRAFLESLPGVARVHELHLWAIDTAEIAMTAHRVMSGGQADDAFLQDANQRLHDCFDSDRVTLQAVRVPFTTRGAPLEAVSTA